MFDENDDLFENVDMDAFESDGTDGIGASPDGLGASPTPEEMANPSAGPQTDFNIPRGGNAYEPGFQGPYPYGATAGEIDFFEPQDTSPEAASRSAGFTVLFVAVATGIGYAVKGGMGAATGMLLAGAAANGYRAQKWWGSPEPSQKHEAIVSGVFAAGGLAAGGYVGYKAMQEKR
jgi:hypothetical protein